MVFLGMVLSLMQSGILVTSARLINDTSLHAKTVMQNEINNRASMPCTIPFAKRKKYQNFHYFSNNFDFLCGDRESAGSILRDGRIFFFFFNKQNAFILAILKSFELFENRTDMASLLFT